MSVPKLMLSALLPTVLPAQDVPWLQLVRCLDVGVPRVAAADVAPDGSLVATVDDRRTVAVYQVEPWRELRHFTVDGTAAVDDVRITADGTVVVVQMAAWEPTSSIRYRLTDGARVDAGAAAVPEPDATPPAGLGASGAATIKMVRTARDHRTAVFRSDSGLGVWREGAVRWLQGASLDDFALTGDGSHVIVTRCTGIDAYPAAGGEPWCRPLGFAPGAALATFGAAAGFVTVDRDSIIVADAAQRREHLRLPTADLGVRWCRVWFAAASAAGDRLAVTASVPGQQEPETMIIDLGERTAKPLPLARQSAAFAAQDLLLFDGGYGVCGAVTAPLWTWLPHTGDQTSWRPLMFEANGVLVPGRAEVIYQAMLPGAGQHDWSFELQRHAAASGAVLARRAVADLEVGSHMAFCGGHLVDLADHDGDYVVELRRVDDLAVSATAPAPKSWGAAAEFRTAAAAPRLVFRVEDELRVMAVVLPAPSAKQTGIDPNK